MMPADERRYYNVLISKSEDVVHYWLQFCLNWPCMTEDLQKLSKVVEVPDTGDIIPLLYFRDTYPNLFECFDAVFHLMMSNSRLCEQIHGMMRKLLRLGTGQREADSQRSYSTGTDYEMKAERKAMKPPTRKRSLDGATIITRKNRKHTDTKDQAHQLGRQLVSRSREFSKRAVPIIDADRVPTKRAISQAGRREQDKKRAKQNY